MQQTANRFVFAKICQIFVLRQSHGNLFDCVDVVSFLFGSIITTLVCSFSLFPATMTTLFVAEFSQSRAQLIFFLF